MSDKFRIPFGKIQIGETARINIWKALDRNWITQGPLVEEFEQKFAVRFGWKHAVAVNSGTAAGTVVWSALREIGGFDHVVAVGRNITHNIAWAITPSCAFAATANCLMAAGVEPVFVDVSLDTLNIDPVRLADRLSEAGDNVTQECVGIQFIGNVGKLDGLQFVVGEAGHLSITADLCEAHGATLDGNSPSTYAQAGLFSFYAAHLMCAGEGGMIGTNDADLADLCRSIRNHGTPTDRKYFDFARFGVNGRMTDLHAAIGLEQLESFDDRFARRREVRAKLIQALQPFEDRLILYCDGPGEIMAPHAFAVVLREEGADGYAFLQHLERNGVETKNLFKSLPTQHAAFRFLGHKLGDFPVAERIGNTGVHFSCGEWISDQDVEFIAKTVKDFLDRN